MKPTRRGFLKLLAGGAGLAAAGAAGAVKGVPVAQASGSTQLRVTTETTSICPYCGCGCGILVSSQNGKVVNTEGDPDHPINEGALCSKGAALLQVAVNKHRSDKVLYRAPGASDWEQKPYEWAIEQVAQRIKASRDETFVTKNAAGQTVNRTTAIANFGGAALDTEETMTISKFARSLGLVNIEHQARL